jgi:hypothetical protein
MYITHGTAQKAAVLTSCLYKRTLERSKVKGRKKMQMKVQLFQATDASLQLILLLVCQK